MAKGFRVKEQREIFNADTSPLKRVNGKLNNNLESIKNKNDKLLANGNEVKPVNKKGINL